MDTQFSRNGNWYKGNLHMHTTVSDGEVTKEEAIKLYKEAGYDFLALTDHWVQSQDCLSQNMLLLSGCEYDTGDMIEHSIYHILGIGMERKITIQKSNKIEPQSLIDEIRNAGGIAILAHPAWSLSDPNEVLNLQGILGAEIFNTVSNMAYKNGRRADSSLYFDLWADKGKEYRCFAGDDSHFYMGEQTQSYIMVKAQELTKVAILKAIRDGNFYASQGPEFKQIEFTGDKLYVSCANADRIIFYTNTVWCYDRSQVLHDGQAVYEIKPTDKFVRVELIDKEGKMAWSSPKLLG